MSGGSLGIAEELSLLYLGRELENCLVSGGSLGIAEELFSALPPAPE